MLQILIVQLIAEKNMVNRNKSKLFRCIQVSYFDIGVLSLEGTPLQNAEDFTALAILLTHTHLSKSELINHNLQEKTSGTEVIRHLIASGLVRQWDDEEDKRSKHIAITDEGKKLLFQIFEHTNYVGR